MSVGKRKASPKARITLPVAAALVICLLIDNLQRFSVGPVSLSGAVTLGLAGLLLLVAPMALLLRHRAVSAATGSTRLEPVISRTWTALPAALGLFLVVAIISLLMYPSQEGLQNVALYVIFAMAIFVTATMSSEGTAARVLPAFAAVALIVTALFFVGLATGVEIYDERPYAATCVVFMAILVPLRSSNLLIRIAPYVLLLGVVLSLSRTSAAVCLMLMIFLVVRGRRGARLLRGIMLLGALVAGGLLVIWNYAPFRDRFFGGDNAIALENGLTLNTSGRDTLWTITLDSWEQSPWFGNGAGSAQQLISSMFRNIAHPHNEYLRLLHDYGIVGLALFSLGMLWLLRQTWIRARHHDDPQHWSAFLVLLAVLVVAVTGNPLISQFIMIPAGALVGLSMASPPPPKRGLRPAPLPRAYQSINGRASVVRGR